MKLYKSYTKKPFSFLMNDAISLSGKSFRFAKILSQNNTQLQKAATIKRSENSPLDGELKKQSDIAKNDIKALSSRKNNKNVSEP